MTRKGVAAIGAGAGSPSLLAAAGPALRTLTKARALPRGRAGCAGVARFDPCWRRSRQEAQLVEGHRPGPAACTGAETGFRAAPAESAPPSLLTTTGLMPPSGSTQTRRAGLRARRAHLNSQDGIGLGPHAAAGAPAAGSSLVPAHPMVQRVVELREKVFVAATAQRPGEV